jgi:hypothetical protein
MKHASFKYNDLIDAFRRLDSNKVTQVVSNDDLNNPDIAQSFVKIIRESGCLLLKYPAPAKEKSREAMVQLCVALISQCPEAAIRDDLNQHIADAHIFEKGFREILATLNQSEIWEKTPAQQAWGMIYRSVAEFESLQKTTQEELSKLAQNEAVFDPNQFRLPTNDKKGTSPDAVLNEIIQGLGNTLSMLGHIHKWFDQHDTLILPDPTPKDDKIEFQVGTHTLLSMQWHHLELAWDRSRLFKKKAQSVKKDFQDTAGQTRNFTVLQVEAPGVDEAKDRVSLDRLIQVFAQRQLSLGSFPVSPRVIGWKKPGPVPLVPEAYLTLEEFVSADVLMEMFHVPLADSAQLFVGLTLKQWLRGYAYYGTLARDAGGNPILDCLRFTEAQLIEGLEKAGLPAAEAARFISLTSLSKTTADVFDTPIVRTHSGDVFFFAPAFHFPVLGQILLSRIASLNRRRDAHGQIANDCQFEDKGAKFERAVLEDFTRAGIPAHGFPFTLNKVDYDCDVAAIMGDTLFVFECKNYTLPMSDNSSLYYFMQGLPEIRAQAKRIASDLEANPDIVRKHFGPTAAWKRVVPVVLFALPWATGKEDGVYIYDASALSRILRDGFVAITAVSNVSNKQVRRRHRHELRKGAVPTAEELETDMKCPSQVKLHVANLQPITRPCPVSDKIAFSIPEWGHRSLTTEEQLICLGETPEKAAAIAHDLEHNFPAVVDKLRHEDKPTPIIVGPKIGRNEKCPCGSGLKYKNCCLDNPSGKGKQSTNLITPPESCEASQAEPPK